MTARELSHESHYGGPRASGSRSGGKPDRTDHQLGACSPYKPLARDIPVRRPFCLEKGPRIGDLDSILDPGDSPCSPQYFPLPRVR